MATGSEAVTPPIDGLDRTGIYTLGSMSDGKDLREYVGRARSTGDLQQPDRGPACQFFETRNGPVGIVGGGYIGVEAVSLDPFADVETNDGTLVIYGEENEAE